MLRTSVTHSTCNACSGHEVPSTSLAMHQLHCFRNIRRCGSCGLTMPVKEFDAHVVETKGSAAGMLAAVARGDVAKLALMLQHGASASQVCDEETGDAPIHIASRTRQAGVLSYLLDAGVSVNASNRAGETPLHITCMLASADKGRLVAVAEGGSGTGRGDTLDGVMSRSGASGASGGPSVGLSTVQELITALLARGCDVEARNAIGDTPLQLLHRSHNLDLALLLTSSGSSLRPVSELSRRASTSTR